MLRAYSCFGIQQPVEPADILLGSVYIVVEETKVAVDIVNHPVLQIQLVINELPLQEIFTVCALVFLRSFSVCSISFFSVPGAAFPVLLGSAP